MAYIAPNSDIYVLSGVPIDETYEHTIYFESANAQANYFISKRKYTFSQQSYQRMGRGYCRVEQLADNMYDCNYMMFRNTAYGSKWFYAFIDNVEYINDNVTEIHYEIDVMQTWHFEYSLNACFVERQHPITDTIGSNTVPECLDLGDYVLSTPEGFGVIDDFTDGMTIAVAATVGLGPEGQIQPATGGYRSGVYHAANYYTFDDPTEVMPFLDALTEAGKEDAIVGVYMIPKAFFDYHTTDVYQSTKTVSKPYTTIGGVTPKNNKLFTYPYQFLCVDMGDDVAEYHYEYFGSAPSDDVTLKLYGTIIGGAEFMVVPISYKGAGLAGNINEKIISKIGFPCTYSVDGYKAWLAQNQYVLAAQERVIERNYKAGQVASDVQGGLGATNLAIGATQMAIGASFKGQVSRTRTMNAGANTAMQGISQIANAELNRYNTEVQKDNAYDMLSATKLTATLKPRVMQGSNTSGIMVGSGWWKPRIYNMHIRTEFVTKIDGYFDRYGYAMHDFKVPYRMTRPHWSYLKTVDCTINGYSPWDGRTHSIPNDDTNKICSIYNSGITFWRNGDEVGNYTLDNRPSS